jgi:hypothetical protein
LPTNSTEDVVYHPSTGDSDSGHNATEYMHVTLCGSVALVLCTFRDAMPRELALAGSIVIGYWLKVMHACPSQALQLGNP